MGDITRMGDMPAGEYRIVGELTDRPHPWLIMTAELFERIMDYTQSMPTGASPGRVYRKNLGWPADMDDNWFVYICRRDPQSDEHVLHYPLTPVIVDLADVATWLPTSPVTLESLYFKRQRTRGWRKPEGSIVCTRSGRWGNPFKVGGFYRFEKRGGVVFPVPVDHGWSPQTPTGGQPIEFVELAVHLYREKMLNECRVVSYDEWDGEQVATISYLWRDAIVRELAGRPLGCACEPGAPCHVQDVLLPMANPDLVPKDR